MGRRYYCDYCDKNFIDVLEARRKHLQSAHHIKLRNLHYEYARDAETILKEELLKIPCRRFSQNGSCPFEGNCKYTHYTPEQLCEIRQQVEAAHEMKTRKAMAVPDIPSIELWVHKYNENSNKEDGDVIHTPWTYPESFSDRLDLPPSLVKFKPEHFFDDNFEEWGK